MKLIQVPVPPPDEQWRVASILGALDDKIDSNRRLSRLLEQVAEAEFQARFVGLDEERDTSGANGATLADVAELTKEQVKPAETPDDLFEHFSIPAFDVGDGPETALGKEMLSAKTYVPGRECILLSKLNPRIKRVWWPWPSKGDHSVCSPEFLVLSPRPGIPTSFLYGTATADDRFYAELLRHATGTTGSRQRVKPAEALGCRVPLPPPSELLRWDSFARPLYDLAHAVMQESHILRQIREVLLPKLISGEIRVPDSADPAETIEPLVEEHAAA